MFAFLGSRREMMNGSMILGAVIVATIIFNSLGSWCECVTWSFWEENICNFVGAVGILEQDNAMRCRRSHPPTLFFVSIQLMRNNMLGLYLWDFYCWSTNSNWFLEMKYRKVWSLEVHKTRITKFDDRKELDLEVTTIGPFFLLFAENF
jgi:hypothetical protein